MDIATASWETLHVCGDSNHPNDKIPTSNWMLMDTKNWPISILTIFPCIWILVCLRNVSFHRSHISWINLITRGSRNRQTLFRLTLVTNFTTFQSSSRWIWRRNQLTIISEVLFLTTKENAEWMGWENDNYRNRQSLWPVRSCWCGPGNSDIKQEKYKHTEKALIRWLFLMDVS